VGSPTGEKREKEEKRKERRIPVQSVYHVTNPFFIFATLKFQVRKLKLRQVINSSR
jgi:hypothetical protein